MFLLLLSLGCADKPVTETADACASLEYDVNWANFGDGFFANYCRACHSAASPRRYDAPEGVNFDTLEEVRTFSALIRTTVIDEGSMPEGGGVYDQDLEFLDYFLECGLD